MPNNKNNLRMQQVSIDDLVPNPWNTNSVSPDNLVKLDASLAKYGPYKPVIVRETEGGLQIVGGEHRWGAMKRAGYTEISIVNLGPIDDAKAKEIGLIDNARYGEDDSLGLANLLRELGSDVTSVMPYTADEFDHLLESTNISFDDLDNIGKDQLPNLKELKTAPKGQVMRFMVQVEDVAWMTAIIEREMKIEAFTGEDQLSNAGMALVSLMKKLEKTL